MSKMIKESINTKNKLEKTSSKQEKYNEISQKVQQLIEYNLIFLKIGNLRIEFKFLVLLPTDIDIEAQQCMSIR
ncbi:MAG: hypothetical protein LBF68_03765 [Christensenellaceae bacterium]|nr:hypothetical protein [Christensenellaceae bacterium]